VAVTELTQGGNFFSQRGEPEGIGASQGYLHYMGKGLLLDAGTGFKKIKGHPIQHVHVPAKLTGHRVDLIICSHQHLDHAGYLPRTAALYGEATVVMPSQCFRILKVMLPDALKISLEEHDKALMLGYKPPVVPFTEEELKAFFALEGTPRLILIDETCELTDLPNLEGWRFEFHSSGHTVGAVSTRITAPDGWTNYWTADIASHNQEICSGVLVPAGWEKPDFMITEATYGGTPIKEPRSETWKRFRAVVNQTHRRGGQVLCPAFAGNRLSNVVDESTRLGKEFGFVTIADGMAVKGEVGERIIDIELGTEKVARLVKEGRLVLINQINKPAGMAQRQAVLDGDYGPVVIVSSSATMENGWSSFWAKHLLPERKNSVILTGYVFPNSVAEEALKKGGNIVMEHFSKKWNKIIKQAVNCACDVYSFSLSAHDYQQGLIQRIVVARPKILVVHHTSDQAYTAYVEALKVEFGRLGLELPRIMRAGHEVVIEL